jgi:dihydroorotase
VAGRGQRWGVQFPGLSALRRRSRRARLLALLNISSIGLIAHSYELSNLDYCDVDLGATIIPAQGPLLKDGPMG